MANHANYGDTVLLDSLIEGSSAIKLQRLPFVKGSDGHEYDEKWLQRLIMAHPGLLPVAQIEPVFEGMVPICQELPLRSGFVDNVFITPTGNIAIVECKLWRNPEARRKVVAQIIDYASEMSTLSYEQFESAVMRARQGQSAEASLFHTVMAGDAGDEASFHDAVTRTLRRGRILLIIIGDGIREGLELMADFLQQHAGLHFTLCLIELALFELPNKQVIAQPRILGKTVNINRGIVELNDSRLEVRPASLKPDAPPLASSISSETFYENLDAAQPGTKIKLQALLTQLERESLDVKADVKAKTLTLRWTNDSGSWNLGTVHIDGTLQMDYHGQQARNLNLSSESYNYLIKLASISPNAQVTQQAFGGWNLRKSGTTPLLVKDFLSDSGRDIWVSAIRQFQLDVMSKQQD